MGTVWEEMGPLRCQNVLGDVAACVLADRLVFDTIPNSCKSAQFIKVLGFFLQTSVNFLGVTLLSLSLFFPHFNKSLPHLSLPAALATF